MNVVTLFNQKGGVGKTTNATHIAAGLAIKGKRVLLIDSDSQANATTQMGIPDMPGIYNLLAQEQEWRKVLRAVNPRTFGDGQVKGQLYVLPSNVETRAIPIVVGDVGLLRERLDELVNEIDVVVIDTSPTPSLLHSMIYMATQYIIYPTECEMMSLTGLNKTVINMEQLNKTRLLMGVAPVTLMGVQPMMYEPWTNAHDYGLSLLTNKFKRAVWPAIPKRTIWRDAAYSSTQRTIFAYESPDKQAKQKALSETWALVARVEKGIVQ